MALFYQHNINDAVKIGIWKIAEDEDFFLQQVAPVREITHPHKRLQHLAGRYLLPVLFDDFPVDEIQVADNRKPFLPSGQYEFSISHCGDYAAAIVSKEKKAGIDIELISPKVERIKHRFLNAPELPPAADLPLLTTFWAAKEAVYKWYGKGGVDFKEHIRLSPGLSVLFCKEEPVQLQVGTRQWDELVLAFVTG